MAVKLHRCKGTFIKGPHPCWKAQKALDEAGIDYQVVYHPILRGGRKEVERMTGQKKLPFIEFEDGSRQHESAEIVARAHAGTLVQPAAPAA
jgi:glutathione S-transferase